MTQLLTAHWIVFGNPGQPELAGKASSFLTLCCNAADHLQLLCPRQTACGSVSEGSCMHSTSSPQLVAAHQGWALAAQYSWLPMSSGCQGFSLLAEGLLMQPIWLPCTGSSAWGCAAHLRSGCFGLQSEAACWSPCPAGVQLQS